MPTVEERLTSLETENAAIQAQAAVDRGLLTSTRNRMNAAEILLDKYKQLFLRLAQGEIVHPDTDEYVQIQQKLSQDLLSALEWVRKERAKIK